MFEIEIEQHPDKTSLDYVWHTEWNETYTSDADEYDVSAAKFLLASQPHPLMRIGFKNGSLKLHLVSVVLNKRRINEADPEFPVIFRIGDDGAFYPIDGNHRMARIDQIGQEWMWAFILTPEESKSICKPSGAVYAVRDIANQDWWRCEFQLELVNNAGKMKGKRFIEVKCHHKNFYLVGSAGSKVEVKPNTLVRFVPRRVQQIQSVTAGHR